MITVRDEIIPSSQYTYMTHSTLLTYLPFIIKFILYSLCKSVLFIIVIVRNYKVYAVVSIVK